MTEDDDEWQDDPPPDIRPHLRITETPPHDIAVLWIRDPEQASGWREYYIRSNHAEPKKKKPMGFAQRKKK